MFQDKEEWLSYAIIDKKAAEMKLGLDVYLCYCKKYSSYTTLLDESDICYDY